MWVWLQLLRFRCWTKTQIFMQVARWDSYNDVANIHLIRYVPLMVVSDRLSAANLILVR
jgi:hypothetical protein